MPSFSRFEWPGRLQCRQPGQRVQGQQNLVGLGFRDVEHENRHVLVRRGLRAKVAVNQHQSIRRLAREQGIGVTDLGQDSLQRGGPFAGVPTPIARVRKQFFGGNPPEFTNPIPDCWRNFWLFSPHPAPPARFG
jgi:hypothetical protein